MPNMVDVLDATKDMPLVAGADVIDSLIDDTDVDELD